MISIHLYYNLDIDKSYMSSLETPSRSLASLKTEGEVLSSPLVIFDSADRRRDPCLYCFLFKVKPALILRGLLSFISVIKASCAC